MASKALYERKSTALTVSVPAWWQRLSGVMSAPVMRSLPMRRLWVLLVAVFLLFSVIGFYVDIMFKGELPYAVALAIAVISGLNAVLWVIVLSRLPKPSVLGLVALQFLMGSINNWLANWMVRGFDLKAVGSETGIHFAATATLLVIIISYVFFATFIGREGRESFRMRNELELAHGIQKTLVPAIDLQTPCFEIYGISRPSDKVGGDSFAGRRCDCLPC